MGIGKDIQINNNSSSDEIGISTTASLGEIVLIKPIFINYSISLNFIMKKPSDVNEIVKQNFLFGTNITEILFESDMKIHPFKGSDINLVTFFGASTIIDDNIDIIAQSLTKKSKQIVVESKISYQNDLTFNSKICPFTIELIPNGTLLKLDVIGKIKVHLIAEKVLASTNHTNTAIHKPNTVECKYNDLAKLESDAKVDFMRDYLVCKQHNLPLPNEVMAIIGFFVGSKIEVSDKVNESFNISVESYQPVLCLGSIHIEPIEII